MVKIPDGGEIVRINKENLAKFFDRKGFYIILFLCIVVVGVTAVYVTNNNLKKMAELKAQQEELNSANNEANMGDYTTENPKDNTINTASNSENVAEKTAENNNALKAAKENAKNTSGEKSNSSVSNGQNKASVSSNADVQTIAQNITSDKNTVSTYTITLLKPVDGDIIMEYAKDKLTYSKTLDEWTTHDGVDIKASLGTSVVAAMDGVVSKIYKDDKLGNTVVIKNGIYETRYANLEDGISVKQGDKVTKGQEIGKVGLSAKFEIAEEPHVHFEILKNGAYLDPSLYFK